MLTPATNVMLRRYLRYGLLQKGRELHRTVPRTNRQIGNRAFSVAAPQRLEQYDNRIELRQQCVYLKHLKVVYRHVCSLGPTVMIKDNFLLHCVSQKRY